MRNNIETFSTIFFTNLAQKLIHEINLEDNDSTEIKLEYVNDEVSVSILMLSYVYRPAFRERFIEVFPILMRAKENFLFLSNHQVIKTKQFYIQQTTEALNDAFHRFIEQDFTKDGWTNIRREAEKIARGFKFLEPFMSKETLNGTISKVADAILPENYGFENKNQQTNAMIPRRPSQQMKSIKASYNEPSSPSSPVVNISQAGLSILLVEDLLTNNIIYTAQNQSHTTFSFGTIDQDPKISCLMQCSDHQDKVVTSENQPSGMVPNLSKTADTANSSDSKSQAQENFTERSFENETEPSFRTVKKTENGMGETCDATNVVISEEELMDGEKQFWKYFLGENSEDELEPSYQIVRQMENCGSENFIASNEIISEQELMDAAEQFWKDNLTLYSITELIVDANEQHFHDLKEKNDYGCDVFSKDENVSDSKEGETFSKEAIIDDPEGETLLKEAIIDDPEGETFSKEAIIDDAEGETLSKEAIIDDPEGETFSKEAIIDDPEGETFSKEAIIDDPEGETFSEEAIIDDPEGETFSKEAIIDDPEGETFSKENTLATGNVLNFPGNQSVAFHQRHSNAAFQFLNTNEEISSHQNEAQQLNKIETNFQTDGNNPFTKILHLNLDGKKLVLQFPADIILIFKYNGSNLSSKQPKT
ncbi:hypothetical protein HNY73_019126 [Argiope bruennichi]|uniref:Uncharacterized protein n=1 Tax=Argiope bruennichi TaxID=94029 RepID=A0A8T0EFP9_ARGBR|nr:hypothetical protein HNY73_019126 [Argiope bruennichi]